MGIPRSGTPEADHGGETVRAVAAHGNHAGILQTAVAVIRIECVISQGQRRKNMPNILRGIIREGKVELSEPSDLPEGTRVLVTPAPGYEAQFWRGASQST